MKVSANERCRGTTAITSTDGHITIFNGSKIISICNEISNFLKEEATRFVNNLASLLFGKKVLKTDPLKFQSVAHLGSKNQLISDLLVSTVNLLSEHGDQYINTADDVDTVTP
jgi:hypothetical protein